MTTIGSGGVPSYTELISASFSVSGVVQSCGTGRGLDAHSQHMPTKLTRTFSRMPPVSGLFGVRQKRKTIEEVALQHSEV